MNKTTAALLTAVLAASLVVFGAGPAAAGGCGPSDLAPDARARVGDGPYTGGGSLGDVVFDLGEIGPGASLSVLAQWKNRTPFTGTIRIKGAFRQVEGGSKVKIFVGAENLTQRFRVDNKGGITFRDVPPGGRTPLIEMRFLNTSPSSFPPASQGVYAFYKGHGECAFVYAHMNDDDD